MKDILIKILADGGKADGRLSDLQKILDANRDRDFIGPVPDVPDAVEKDPGALKGLGFTEDMICRAQEDLPDASGIDPDQWKGEWERRGEESRRSFLMAVEIMRGAALGFKGFKVEEEKAAGDLQEGFAQGTDLGDLFRIALGDEDALSRFLERRPQPIHRGRWKESSGQELNDEIRRRMELDGKSRKAVLRDVCRRAALFAAGQVLREGWRTSNPRGKDAKKKAPRIARRSMEKAVGIGEVNVLLHEPTPPEVVELLSGDVATLDDRILKASVVGAGAVRPKSPEEVAAFLREMGFSPGELGLLLREARDFIAECLRNAARAIFQVMNDEATDDLLGARTRGEVAKALRSIPNADDDGEEILASEDPEEALIDQGVDARINRMANDLIEKEEYLRLVDSLQDDRLTDRDRMIIKARLEGQTWKEIAEDLAISHAAARKAGSRICRKARKILP